MQNWKRNLLFVSKLTRRLWWILAQALENLKNSHNNGQSFTKVYNVWVKKVQRSYVWWQWILIKNLKKNWLFLSKLTWGIWETFTRTLESLKIGNLIGFFYPKWKMSELKIYKKFFCHDIKNDAKLEVEFTFVSKLTWGLWWILAWALENLNNLLFNGMPLTKLYYVRVKKVQRSYVWKHLILMQNLKKTDFCFMNVARNLGNFPQSTWKSQNWDFDGYFLSKVENLWA